MEELEKYLDSCLTTETLETIYPFEKQVEDILLSPSIVKERHRSLKIDLLEKVGFKVQDRLGRNMRGDELFKVMRRVDQFLKDRNFLIVL